MKNNEVVRIAIAETSVIIRGGLTAALKRLSNVKVQPIDVVPYRDVLALFDLDNTSASHLTRRFLERAEQAGQQGTTEVAFTVLDVLGYLDEIPVCVGYEIDVQTILRSSVK